MSLHTHACVYARVNVYAVCFMLYALCMHACMHACMYVACVYIYPDTHTHTHIYIYTYTLLISLHGYLNLWPCLSTY